jgi:hypothetical protein
MASSRRLTSSRTRRQPPTSSGRPTSPTSRSSAGVGSISPPSFAGPDAAEKLEVDRSVGPAGGWRHGVLFSPHSRYQLVVLMGIRLPDWLSFPRSYGGALVCAFLLSGCSAPSGFSLFTSNATGEKLAAATQAETCSTPEKCSVQLKKMINDPKRDWVGQKQAPDEYSNGTRLFAYRALRRKLSCDEIKRALEETGAALPSLEPPRYAKARTLMIDVGRELNVERERRCRPRA